MTARIYRSNKNLMTIEFDPTKRQATLEARGLDISDHGEEGYSHNS